MPPPCFAGPARGLDSPPFVPLHFGTMNISAFAVGFATQAPAADTVVTVAARDTLDLIQFAAVLVLALALLAVAGVFVRVGLELRRLLARLGDAVERADRQIDPVIERARSVAENVDYVSHSVRTDVEKLTESVERIRRRLDDASDRMEARVEEFNALLEVVQSEAEDVFLDTASTVRGVRAGSDALRRIASTDGGDEGD